MLTVKGKQHKTRAIAKDSFVKIYQSPQGEWILETKTDGIETIIVTVH